MGRSGTIFARIYHRTEKALLDGESRNGNGQMQMELTRTAPIRSRFGSGLVQFAFLYFEEPSQVWSRFGFWLRLTYLVCHQFTSWSVKLQRSSLAQVLAGNVLSYIGHGFNSLDLFRFKKKKSNKIGQNWNCNGQNHWLSYIIMGRWKYKIKNSIKKHKHYTLKQTLPLHDQ